MIVVSELGTLIALSFLSFGDSFLSRSTYVNVWCCTEHSLLQTTSVLEIDLVGENIPMLFFFYELMQAVVN